MINRGNQKFPYKVTKFGNLIQESQLLSDLIYTNEYTLDKILDKKPRNLYKSKTNYNLRKMDESWLYERKMEKLLTISWKQIKGHNPRNIKGLSLIQWNNWRIQPNSA